MGYCGLENWVDSDMAADLVGNVVDKMVKELKKGLKEDNGICNTNGPENVAMFVEAFIKPNVNEWGIRFCATGWASRRPTASRYEYWLCKTCNKQMLDDYEAFLNEKVGPK